jgi:hypothetical protein
MFKRLTQTLVASAVLMTAGCAADPANAPAAGQKQRLEIPIVTGVGDFLGQMVHGRPKHRQPQEQPVIDVATTPVQE